MKILTVAIPNHHFFKWIEHLEHSGHEVFWFDITDGGGVATRIQWVKQFKGWKLKYDYPFRTRIKRTFPKLYKSIAKLNENSVSSQFSKVVQRIHPDVIHCFEMQLSGLPILEVLQQYKNIPLIYSSWGSDIYDYKRLGVTDHQFSTFSARVDYLITDCKRDYKLAASKGFSGVFLGVFPGNGGICINSDDIEPIGVRKTIMIKGYDDGVGKAIQVLQAIELLPEATIKQFDFIIYSADNIVIKYIENSNFFNVENTKVLSRYSFVKNELLLAYMGQSLIHIGNSISDGMPNALLEAMGMGAFPIQSNPGNVTEEVIEDGKNGFLIQNPLDVKEIAELIMESLSNSSLLKKAMNYNTAFIAENYNRETLQPKIASLYQNLISTNEN
ncbi:Glycosyltransferase involved in cell wall bisynthesis [Pustulibacterium marinum]|uniref:Glycosyltransferase involved in cell wall bisynthesis n=1 Tax=Pustulibacterium marinum TaxID=1224947 RepID=A0A1I7HMG2_9FLAO|nr:glycosyltransferase [Pustulibacterium marinum]SFU61898.1 Glycosyltransferase involved in cell wall bisynthesis [Pustulibacterium marinum]